MEKPTYTLDWLLNRVNRKEKVKFYFFWGHTPNKDGSVGKSCFSQWWHASFAVDGVRYATAEHWMMAKKAELFGDGEMIPKILQTSTPKEAKQLGKKMKGFDQQCWEANGFALVAEGNYHKFAQHPELKAFLLDTGSHALEIISRTLLEKDLDVYVYDFE